MPAMAGSGFVMVEPEFVLGGLEAAVMVVGVRKGTDNSMWPVN